ncbi:hypothetical protein K9M48_01085 [Candidatus Gracilibacteria bacterium]|nr:hypothetical protein [Candidatus Gracilibacteria bacterium]
MLSQTLKEFGLSEKEANVYLACLELGHAPVSSIARNINENRVTTYSILKNLVKVGIAQTLIKNKSTYYSVISPDKLLKTREMKCENFKSKLPEFMAISHKFDNKPQVQFFEGIQGVKQAYEDILSSQTKNISSFLGVGSVSKNLLEYLNLQFLPQRIKIGIHAKVLLCSNDQKADYLVYNKKSKQALTQYKVLDFDFINLYNEINIYGDNKVLFVLFGEDEMSALIIQSKKLHDSLQSIFDLNWFIADKCLAQEKKAKTISSLQKKKKKSSKKSS